MLFEIIKIKFNKILIVGEGIKANWLISLHNKLLLTKLINKMNEKKLYKTTKPTSWRRWFIAIATILLLNLSLSFTGQAQTFTGPYSYHEDWKQTVFVNVGWKWGIESTIAISIDLDDLMQSTADGQADWVTVWVSRESGLSMALTPGVDIGYSVSQPFGYDPETGEEIGAEYDPGGHLLSSGFDINFQAGFAGMSISSGPSPDVSFSVSAAPAVGLTMGKIIVAFEMRRSIILNDFKLPNKTQLRQAINSVKN